MKRNLLAIVALLMGASALTSALTIAAEDEKREVKGMIKSRTGETLVITGSNGGAVVVLNEHTRVKDDRGLFGLDKEALAPTVLIPGLKVRVDGVGDSKGRVVAQVITVDGDDLESAEMIQAGLHPTAEQVATNVDNIERNRKNAEINQQNIATHEQKISANQQGIASNRQQIAENMKDIEENTNRFTALAEYDVRAQATVKFDVGSTKLSPESEQELKKLAQSATSLTGYIVEVTGFADSTGSAAMNTKLSEGRAKGVVTFLMQQGGIPVRHIIAPGAMGEYGPAATNETKTGRADNRRVEVKVLVNKGISGE
jgi:OmpA-OmpF porin, OOP family